MSMERKQSKFYILSTTIFLYTFNRENSKKMGKWSWIIWRSLLTPFGFSSKMQEWSQLEKWFLQNGAKVTKFFRKRSCTVRLKIERHVSIHIWKVQFSTFMSKFFQNLFSYKLRLKMFPLIKFRRFSQKWKSVYCWCYSKISWTRGVGKVVKNLTNLV